MSGNLKSLLLRMIAADGPIRLDRYMGLCLSHPEYGYYMKGEPIGGRGAFTTAPEISQMFGEFIGAWSHAVWRSMGAPRSFNWVELGPGRGTLFSDAMRAIRTDPAFVAAARGYLIDTSPVLEAQQRRHLENAMLPLTWVTDILSVPSGVPSIIIANEFFDALPVRHFLKDAGGWSERYVGAMDGELAWINLHNPLLQQEIALMMRDGGKNVPTGGMIEASPAQSAYMSDVATRLSQDGGAMLVIDYGEENAQSWSTFQALQDHRFHDPLQTPGDADLTTHVNFYELVRGLPANVQSYGPVRQGAFLRILGIEARAKKLQENATPEQSKAIDLALHRLTHDSEMGRLFKVVAVCHDAIARPPGFAV